MWLQIRLQPFSFRLHPIREINGYGCLNSITNYIRLINSIYTVAKIYLFFSVVTVFTSQLLFRHHLKETVPYPCLREQCHFDSIFFQGASEATADVSGFGKDTFDQDTGCRNSKIVSRHPGKGWEFSRMELMIRFISKEN